MNTKTKYTFFVMILYGSIIQSLDISKESVQTANSTMNGSQDTTKIAINGGQDTTDAFIDSSKNTLDNIKSGSKKTYKKTKNVRKKFNDFFTKGKV